MVLRLANSLDTGLREANELLHAAGLPATYPRAGFASTDLAPYRAARDALTNPDAASTIVNWAEVAWAGLDRLRPLTSSYVTGEVRVFCRAPHRRSLGQHRRDPLGEHGIHIGRPPPTGGPTPKLTSIIVGIAARADSIDDVDQRAGSPMSAGTSCSAGPSAVRWKSGCGSIQSSALTRTQCALTDRAVDTRSRTGHTVPDVPM